MSNRNKVEQLREKMAEVDLEVLRILEKRARLAREVGALIKDEPPMLPTHDSTRLDTLLDNASGDLPKESIQQVFKVVHAASASLEGPVRVAFVGADGSLAHVASRRVFGAGVQAFPCESAPVAFDELSRGRVDFAVAPFESSHDGPVLNTILALRQTELVVTGLCELAASVALMSRTGNVSDIEKIYATAHDHARCEVFLAERLPRATIIDVRSSSIACQFASEDHGGAAIAHEQTGLPHSLSVVLANIGDQHELRMRYAIIGTRPSPRSGKDVTSLVFTLSNEPGALLAVLGDFAKRGVNVKNIMSRPMPGEVWDYLFYIDVMGHATDRSIVAALDDIRKHTRLFKLIGSYPTQC